MDSHPLGHCPEATRALQKMVGCSMARGWRKAINENLAAWPAARICASCCSTWPRPPSSPCPASLAMPTPASRHATWASAWAGTSMAPAWRATTRSSWAGSPAQAAWPRPRRPQPPPKPRGLTPDRGAKPDACPGQIHHRHRRRQRHRSRHRHAAGRRRRAYRRQRHRPRGRHARGTGHQRRGRLRALCAGGHDAGRTGQGPGGRHAAGPRPARCLRQQRGLDAPQPSHARSQRGRVRPGLCHQRQEHLSLGHPRRAGHARQSADGRWRPGGGSFINIASTAGLRPRPG